MPMELLFVGTGAADWPSEYVAERSSAMRGEVRGYASILVERRILVDCGATVPTALRLLGVPLEQISDVLITHTHGDHLDAAALAEVAGARPTSGPLRVWADVGAVEQLPKSGHLDVRRLVPGAPAEVAGIIVTPLIANHQASAAEQALHFRLEHNGVRCLYATDGAWLLKEAWLALRGQPLDALVWDATIGDAVGDWRIFEHNSVDMIRVMLQTLRVEGVVDAHTRILLTHVARTLCAPHAQMAARLAPEGLVPAHDGMLVELRSGNRLQSSRPPPVAGAQGTPQTVTQ
jgi:hypothetical protein